MKSRTFINRCAEVLPMNYKGLKDKKFSCLYCGSEIPFKGYSYTHKYCNNTCSSKHKAQTTIDSKRSVFAEGNLTERKHVYSLLVERDGNQCSVCHIQDWQGRFIRFWVDHIDGNASNNHPDNFRLICPNCDSQSDTFGARNTGNGRKSRGMKMYD